MKLLNVGSEGVIWFVGLVHFITPIGVSVFASEEGGSRAIQSNRSDPARVLAPSQTPDDQRANQSRNIISGYPFIPPADRSEWEQRRREVRTRVLVASGLWPMPNKPQLAPVIHGRIDKDGYTIEKVYFESLPGHYVSGNLYRPKGRPGRSPAVLFAHGHWGDGRKYEADDKTVAKLLQEGGEKFEANARYSVQAPLATLARMGCVVFQHDMVGRGDSRALGHGKGFSDAEAVLRLQSALGLQTWNSIRALDFLAELPDVDASRIGVTGASGGGTQTILLCAIDDRPACAFPAAMVSTSMQGGCDCENAPLLRIGGGNVEIAALFAPKPLAMSNAGDWTLHFDRQGLPELKALYRMLGAPNMVAARCYPQFRHNFNQISREMMYEWMNKHLQLGAASTVEQPIAPEPPARLSVFDAAHRPVASSVDQLRAVQTKASDDQMAKSSPRDRESLATFQRQISDALQVMAATKYPEPMQVAVHDIGTTKGKGFHIDRMLLSRVVDPQLFARESIPAVCFLPDRWNGTRLVVWVHAQGHAGLLDPSTKLPGDRLNALLQQGIAVLSPDVLLTGEFTTSGAPASLPKVSMKGPRFTLCYNRSILANRTHDVLTALGAAEKKYRPQSIDLAGLDEAGPWVILARALSGGRVRRTVADFDNFSFSTVTDVSDPKLLPGGLKYGDLIGLARLCAPGELYAMGTELLPKDRVAELKRAYDLSEKAGGLLIADPSTSEGDAWKWLTRP